MSMSPTHLHPTAAATAAPADDDAHRRHFQGGKETPGDAKRARCGPGSKGGERVRVMRVAVWDNEFGATRAITPLVPVGVRGGRLGLGHGHASSAHEEKRVVRGEGPRRPLPMNCALHRRSD